MREILFRGKRIDNGEWVYGYYSKHSTGKIFIRCAGMSCLFSFEVDPETVGMCVPGITDKNGKKIFEGDIVNAYNEINGCIKFGEYKCPYEGGTHLGFYVEWENKHGYSSMRKDLGYWKDKIEVIGNTHDNPELLEVGE